MRNTRFAALTSVAAVAHMSDAPATPKAPRVEPTFTNATNAIAMPARNTKRGSKSIYPFASLTAVGMSFGVIGKDAASLSSVISNANKKAMAPKLDDQGNRVMKPGAEMKDAGGAVIGRAPGTEPEMISTAKYFAVDVSALPADQQKVINAKGSGYEGATALIFRSE